MHKHALVWFKNDLRLHDNETLTRAIAQSNKLSCIFIVDPKLYNDTSLGFKKTAINRFVFLEQTVLDLKKRLQHLGNDLIILSGDPPTTLAHFTTRHAVDALYMEMEYASEELTMVAQVKSAIDSKIEIHKVWGKTLYHIQDIPFTIDKIPLTSKAYRIPTSQQAVVRNLFATPTTIPKSPINLLTGFPACENFAFAKAEYPQAQPYLTGGETHALARLQEYTFQTQQLTNYRWTRNRSHGMDYSSKFSAYLALGSLSPRLIHATVKNYEREIKKNQSTWWIIFELVWRDFFTFKGMRMGNAIFKTAGYRKKELEFTNNGVLFKRWCEGTTGVPFVDAHMRQLNETGYMSNRGRVNCASFLVHDYKIDWTWGAAYFESKLIDYDVSANWMNWHVQAYEIWYTNPVNQSYKYKAAAYIKEWILELREVEDAYIHIPWLSPQFKELNYPSPATVYTKWYRAINLILKSMDKSPIPKK